MSGVIFYDGKPLATVQEAIDLDIEIDKDTPPVVMYGLEFEGEILDVKLDAKQILSLMLGKKITNNWLKMHGGIMTRRGGKRKR